MLIRKQVKIMYGYYEKNNSAYGRVYADGTASGLGSFRTMLPRTRGRKPVHSSTFDSGKEAVQIEVFGVSLNSEFSCINNDRIFVRDTSLKRSGIGSWKLDRFKARRTEVFALCSTEHIVKSDNLMTEFISAKGAACSSIFEQKQRISRFASEYFKDSRMSAFGAVCVSSALIYPVLRGGAKLLKLKNGRCGELHESAGFPLPIDKKAVYLLCTAKAAAGIMGSGYVPDSDIRSLVKKITEKAAMLCSTEPVSVIAFRVCGENSRRLRTAANKAAAGMQFPEPAAARVMAKSSGRCGLGGDSLCCERGNGSEKSVEIRKLLLLRQIFALVLAAALVLLAVVGLCYFANGMQFENSFAEPEHMELCAGNTTDHVMKCKDLSSIFKYYREV